MKVFKLYLQVLKSKLPMVYMYSGVFISIMLIITFLGPQNNSNLEFTGAKINIAYIDKDNTEFTRNLKEEISKNASIIDLGTNEEELNDALFFRRITIIVRVPDGFTADLENNVDSEIRFSSLPDSYEQELLSRRVNKYINTYKAYRIGTNLSLEEVIEKTNEDMAVTSKVSMSSSNLDGNTSLEARYFNYAVYIILAILISVIGLTMNSINNQIVKKRILCSGIKNSSFSLGLTAGHFVFGMAMAFIIILIWLVIQTSTFGDLSIVLYILNLLSITMVGISISFLIAIVIKGNGAISAASNVVSLGMCFISGVFVPQELLSPVVLKIATFVPVYWNVLANSEIYKLTNYTFEKVLPILEYMGIQLAFAVVIWLIAMIVIKKQRTEE